MSDLVKRLMVFSNGKAYDKLKAIFLAIEILPELILLDVNMHIWDRRRFLDEFTKIPITSKATIYILTSSNDPKYLKKQKSCKRNDLNFLL